MGNHFWGKLWGISFGKLWGISFGEKCGETRWEKCSQVLIRSPDAHVAQHILNDPVHVLLLQDIVCEVLEALTLQRLCELLEGAKLELENLQDGLFSQESAKTTKNIKPCFHKTHF